jgi:hypothetical protein
MRRIPLFAAVAVTLAACQFGARPTNTPAIKAADKESTAIREQCAQRHANGELTLTQSVECSNPHILAAFDAAHYPYMGLLRLGMAARLAGAEKVEKGELSFDAYQHQLSELRGRVADEIDRRNAEVAEAQKETGATPPPRSETLDPATSAKLLDGLSAFSSLLPNAPAAGSEVRHQ